MTKVELALAYLNKGYSVIPLKSPAMVKRSNKFKKDVEAALAENSALENPRPADEIYQELFYRECKKPFVPWKTYQERFATKDEVAEWFTKNPDANIGIVTGTLSNLVVFDLDSEEAVKYAEEKGSFPDNTPKAKTGKGYHAYMQHPGFEIRNDVDTKLKIDIRGDGGYVVAPPSIHGSGVQYEWVEGRSVFDVDPVECSTWMIDYFREINEQKKKPKDKTKSDNKPAIKNHIPDNSSERSFADLISNGVSEGERNHTAVKVIGLLLETMSKDNAWAFAMAWNRNNRPPLLKDELKGIFETLYKLDKKVEISIEGFLDTPESILEDYSRNHTRVSFAKDNLTSLERIMNGGFAGGKLYILGGIPNAGKTALLNNFADNICFNGTPVIIFSLDDSRTDFQLRTLSRFGDHDINAYALNRIFNIDKVLNDTTIKNILKLKYVIQKNIPVEMWTELVEKITKKHGKPPVIMIDYLKKVKTGSNIGDERLRIDDIVGKLTSLAKDRNIPVIAISELARDSYRSGQKLGMASFKESGSIEYEASWLGILAAVQEGKNGGYDLKENWEDIVSHDGNIDLIIFKAKGGTGTTGRVPLKLNISKMTFTDRTNDKTAVHAGKKSSRK
jgi:KaiC/GvpD/RAD55 family RecA-like ATPase